MGKLESLYKKLNDTVFSRYTPNGIYFTEKNNRILEIQSKELIEIGRMLPSREHIMIAYFETEPTRVQYLGEDAKAMRKTLDDLRLPNCSSNLGEKTFSLFRSYLKEDYSGPISLEQLIVPGNEHKFELVLKRFLWVYYGKEINSEFYESIKKH